MATCPTCHSACDDGATACPRDGTLLTDPLLGRILGDRYRILKRIGEGGMGTVYRAEHVLLRKRVAVKVLRPELSADEDLVRRFQQEAIAASQIGQENIVDVTDFGRTAQGALYFVMEELPGQSLGAILRAQGPLPLERAAPILAQVCRALAAAHGHGIVHRDLKPDNVIVVRRDDGTDFVKVVDFGISKTGSGREPGRVTRAGTIIGTPEYMAPEQGAAATVDHRADVYAFGVLTYELLTGTLPFQGETAVATLLEHQTKVPEPPSRRRPGLSPDMEKLILRALAKRREDRPQSMAEVASVLTGVLVGLGLPPVYERAPQPPPTVGPYAGFTERFEAPVAARPSTGRGDTVALEPPAEPMTLAPAAAPAAEPAPDLAAAPPPAPAPPRMGGRVLAMAVVGLAIALATGAVLAWNKGTAASATTTGATPTSPPLPARADPVPTAVAAAQASPPGPVDAPPTPSPAEPDRAGERAPEPAATPTRPDLHLHGNSPKALRPPRPARRALGEAPGSGENPYRKLDDLKPDPF